MYVKALLFGVCLFTAPAALLAADEKIVFGLKHTIITNAAFGDDEYTPLRVSNIAYCEPDGTNGCVGYPPFGASIHLGAADGGIFVSPNCAALDGASMEGISYGTVGGMTNSLIGSVKATRNGFGTYETHVDFSGLGATSYTYQAYFHDLQTLEISNRGPDSICYVGSYGPHLPRINPIVLRGGRAGVMVEFDDAITDFYVPGFHVYASRLIILADNPTNTVEHASRVDVFGYDGLSEFTVNAEALGKFGLYHQAIGGVRLHSSPTQLTLSNVVSADFDGMVTELHNAKRYEATLLPYVLTNEYFIWSFSASGVSSASPWPGFFGEVRFGRTDSGVLVTGNFYPGNSVVRVYNGNIFAGSVLQSNGVLGAIADSNLVLTSYFAAAAQTNEAGHIGFRLASAVTLSNANGTTLTGDEFRVSSDGTSETIGSLSSFALVGERLGEVTLTSMQTQVTTPAPLRLRISGSGSSRQISWPYAPDYYLYSTSDLNTPFGNFEGGGAYTNFESYTSKPITNGASFFRLRHIYAGFLVTPMDASPEE